MCEDYLYLQGLGDYWIQWMTETIPEIYDITLRQRLEESGVPFPIQTANCQLPNLLDEATYERSDFNWVYPPGNNIRSEDFGFSVEETLQGVYLDVNMETDPNKKITSDNILSQGIGRATKIFK
jgi:hypothetical protein